MSKIYFLSFADSKCLPMLRRIHGEAEDTGWFDYVKTIDEHSFDKWYVKAYRSRFHLRGFGYWMWKSYVVRQQLAEMQEDDILLYADAGCSLNKQGEQRWMQYLAMVKENPFGLLAFEQESLLEEQWTKADLLAYTNGNGGGNQLFGGIFLMRKTPKTVEMVEQWYDLCHHHFDLITDSPSSIPNAVGFQENRHDQSAFSCLARKYSPVLLSASETFTDGNFALDLKDCPIWATRNRAYTWLGLKKMTLKKKFPRLFGWIY